MQLSEMINKRKSVRKYTTDIVDAATLRRIEEFCASAKPLYPEIRVRAEIVDKEQVKCILPWIPPQAVAIFSEEKEGYLENAGFLFQQLDLYLQSIGLGGCWLGMGRMDAQVTNSREDGMKFVILLAFGYPKEELHRESSQFNRRSLGEISDRVDERLEPARLAPSSINSQPWYFTHEGDDVHVYCTKLGLLKAMALGNMNRIDMGIVLAHLYVTNPDTFRFFKADQVKEVKGYSYVGSVIL